MFLRKAIKRLMEDDQPPRFLHFLINERRMAMEHVNIIITSLLEAGVDSVCHFINIQIQIFRPKFYKVRFILRYILKRKQKCNMSSG